MQLALPDLGRGVSLAEKKVHLERVRATVLENLDACGSRPEIAAAVNVAIDKVTQEYRSKREV
jgi:hypothetical protein